MPVTAGLLALGASTLAERDGTGAARNHFARVHGFQTRSAGCQDVACGVNGVVARQNGVLQAWDNDDGGGNCRHFHASFFGLGFATNVRDWNTRIGLTNQSYVSSSEYLYHNFHLSYNYSEKVGVFLGSASRILS